jgi:hypothetical protein
MWLIYCFLATLAVALIVPTATWMIMDFVDRRRK